MKTYLHRLRLLLPVIGLLSGTFAHAILPGFCGNVNLQTTTNEQIMTLVHFNDMNSNRRIDRQQCGLAGEEFRICSACTNDFPLDSMKVLWSSLKDKAHTDWHTKWHKVRLGAEQIDESLFAKLQTAEIVPKGIDKNSFFKMYGTSGTRSGENFFYMHRVMIKMIQFDLAINNKPCVAEWTKLPASTNDSIWPVPRKTESTAAIDRERLVELRNSVAKFQDVNFLKTVSLNQLGRIVEPTLHQNLHIFYRSNPICSAESVDAGICDDLLPVETSHLNKYFWKIHGLMDNLLGRWLAAHNYKEIALNCGNRSDCYQWKGTWVGRYPKPATK